jgi:hypothetical protein
MSEDIPRPRQPNNALAVVRKIVALAVLAGLVGYDLQIGPNALAGFSNLLAEQGWGVLLQPEVLFCLAGWAFEAFLVGVFLWGGVFAQAGPTQGEIDIANVFVLILIGGAAIVGEILTAIGFAAAGPIGWPIALAIILGSLMIIYGTIIWLWMTQWILLRRFLCFTWLPNFRTQVIQLWLTSVSCLQWALQSYQTCSQWGTQTTQQCANWITNTTTNCIGWSTTTTNTCKSWLPSFLGWLCILWDVVVTTVCIAVAVVVTTVCGAWYLLVQVVCVLWLMVTVLVCLLWMVVVTVITIVTLIFIGLTLIVFFCV